MAEQKYRLDIRIIKFQDYIRRKPESPFGYYGLGIQYLLSGKPAPADRMFMHALKLNPDYTPAKLGKLEFLLTARKFLSAARYYHKNMYSFGQKKVTIKRVQQITSQLYLSRGFYRQIKKLGAFFLFKEGSGVLQKMFNTGPDNPVVNILLAMYLLKNGNDDERARVFYNLCIGMEGINDKLRWDLIQALMKEQPAVLQDENIAGFFSTIPDNVCGKDYANFLLNRFISQQNTDKVLNAFSALQRNQTLPDKKTLWQYLYFCWDRDIWNPTLFLCCQKLIQAGWIDAFIASTIKELKNRGLAENSRDIDKVLSLYGYL